MFEWKRITLNDCLEQYRNTIFVNDDVEYGQITISNNNTIRFRGVKLGKTIGRKRQFLIDLKTHPNTVIFTRQGVADGSIGFAPKEVHGCIATENMPMFSVKNNVVAPELLGFFFRTFLFKQYVQSIETTGSAQKALHEKDLLQLPINIPSLLSNQQVVLKKLHASSVKIEALNVEFTKQQKHLKQLRQAILQEAIEGKLTAQWRAENPVIKGDPNTDAHALLAQIHAEKQSLIAQGKLKKDKPLAPITDDEKPFELPAEWVWVRLGEIAFLGTGATPLTSNHDYYQNGTIDWLSSSVTGQDFVLTSDKKITELAIKETNCTIYPVGTLLVAMYGEGKTRGQITELMIEAATNQAVAAIILHIKSAMSHRLFVKYYFKKIYFELRALASGGAQPNLNMAKVKNTVIPIPSLSEQSAIVTKVQHLLAQVDALEAELQTRQQHAEQLMQSVLREAFHPNS